MAGGWVLFTPETGKPVPLVLNTEPDRSGGVGGWQTAERRRRRPGKWWQGVPDDAMTLDLTIDPAIFSLTATVDQMLRAVRDMGQPSGDDEDPPPISISGDLWASDQNVNWVMSDLKLGERLWFPDGTLRRQKISVDLERFTDIADISAVRVTKTRTRGKRRRRVYHAHTHDTLRSIALRELGASGRWKDLQKWNPKLRKVDPDYPIRHGTHVVIK